MPFSPTIAEFVLAACREGSAETAEALSRGLGGAFTVDAEKIESFQYAGPPPEWNGPGLVLVLQVDETAALVLIAESSGLVPEWAHRPDATGQSKLNTLAQELGMTLLPEEYTPLDYQGGYVGNLAEAVKRGGVPNDAGAIHCVVSAGEKTAALRLIWPATNPAAVLGISPRLQPVEEPSSAPALMDAEREVDSEEQLEEQLGRLPSYVKSLLRIPVTLSVQLASTKQPVSRILDIGPGSIIQFDKNCEQPLTLFVGSQVIAEGEAVKVGEKFGIKLTSMVLPGERFFALRGKRAKPAG